MTDERIASAKRASICKHIYVRVLRWTSGVVLGLLVLIGSLIRLDIPADEIEARYADPASRFMEIDGMRVHYRDQGAGPVLDLVHGSNASLNTWDGWVGELSNDFRVISMDLPGHGLTGPNPSDRYDWATMAEVVGDLIDRLEISTLHIAGNSMGGAIALRYTLRHPDKVEKLILVDSRGLQSEEPAPPIFRAYAMPLIGNLMTLVTPRFAVAGSLEDLYGDKSKMTEKLVSLYHDLMLREGNRRATRLRLSEQPSYDLADQLATISVPTLIIWGGADTWILLKYGNRFHADIPNSELRIFDGLGHTPMEEAPVMTAQEARAFLVRR